MTTTICNQTGLSSGQRELDALNERQVVLPLEPVADSVVHADLTQWLYPRLGILSARFVGCAMARTPDQLAQATTIICTLVLPWRATVLRSTAAAR